MRYLIIFITLFLGAAATQAADNRVQINTLSNSVMSGYLVEQNDTAITFVWDLSLSKKTIPISQIKSAVIGRQYYLVENNKFVEVSTSVYTETQKLQKQRKYRKESVFGTRGKALQREGDPNYAIGCVLKQTGDIALSIGVPTMTIGAILLAYGCAGSNNNINMSSMSISDIKQMANDADSKGKCAMAGAILLPFGGALTVVGIPLSIKGKHIMDIKFNYTGNGAGVAVEF